MTFWQWLNGNWTKILGSFTAALGALQVMISAGVMDKLVSDVTRGWLGVIIGVVTAAVGFNNSTKEKVAAAMEMAIKSTPPQQGGFVRPFLLILLGIFSIVTVIGFTPGCTSIGIPQPTSFNDRVYTAYNTVETIAKLTNDLAVAEKLSKNDVGNVVEQLKNCQTALNLASSIYETTPDLGEDKLRTTLAILQALSNYVNGVK